MIWNACNPKYGEYQGGLASVIKFLIKSQKAVVLKLCQINNLQTNFINQLLENLWKKKVYYSFKDFIWRIDLADMQLINKQNK